MMLASEAKTDIRTIVRERFPDFSEDEHMSFWTRENGSVGDEEYSEADVQKARSLCNAIKERWPKASVSIDTCDEWVIVEVG